MSVCNVHQAQDCHSGCPYRMDLSHLVALRTRLSHERNRFAVDGAEIRKVWIAQIEREIANEEKFLGIEPSAELLQMTDDELLAELES